MFIAALTAAACALSVAAPTVGARAREGTLREIGFMPYEFGRIGDPQPPGMVVDDRQHLGFVLEFNAPASLFVYDLRALRLAQRVPLPDEIAIRTNAGREFAASDPDHHRIFYTLSASEAPDPACRNSPIAVLDTVSLTWNVRSIPCLTTPFPGGVVISGMTYDEASDKLLLTAMPAAALATYRYKAPYPWQPTIYLQVDPDTFDVDWVADASRECNWHENVAGPATLGRSGDRLVAFCLQGGGNQNAGGGRGHVLTMPFVGTEGLKSPDVSQAKAAPTFADPDVLRIVDPVTGRVLLIARSLPFGPAVWVYDAHRSWFNGVIPTGVDPNSLEGYDYGFDRKTGRLYVHTSQGYVLVDARHTPLPGGVRYAVDTDPNPEPGTVKLLSIDTGLRRIFRPHKERQGWVVLEDTVPPPPAERPYEPDAGTFDIPEQPGTTDRTYAGTGNAHGVHILNVGGLPAILQANTARADCAQRRLRAEAPCVFSTLVAPGNREYFLAQSATTLDRAAGATGFATPGRSAPRDFATDADVQSVSRCYADRADQLYAGSAPVLGDACSKLAPHADAAAVGPLEGFRFSKLSGGTRPREQPSDDVPLPSSGCTDSGGGPTAGAPTSSAVGTSAASCDAGKAVVEAKSRVSAVLVPDLGMPNIAVADASATLKSYLDPERGLVSVAEAVAEGVRIGDFVSIGRVQTRSETVARGRSGTASTTFERRISDVKTPGFSCASTCDPHAVATAITRAFGGLVQARVQDPHRLASPRGYTGLVAKDPALVASDVAINDNDEVTVNGLDLIVVNDYARGRNAVDGQNNAGRSRLIVGLAGVQAESHYGIFPLPKQAGDDPGDRGPLGPGDLPNVDAGPYGPGGLRPVDSDPPTPRPAPGLGGGGGNGGGIRLPRNLPEAAAQAVRLIVNNPREAALLAFFLAILVAPLYFAVRRRAVASVYQA